jgi:NAD+-dependent protein deacetylase sirtuin 4
MMFHPVRFGLFIPYDENSRVSHFTRFALQSVPKSRVELCNAAIANADGLLVVGSSLAVHSAYRHVRAASKLGIPVCILNVGETRAEKDELPGVLKIEAPAGSTLREVAQRLTVD